MQSVIEGFRPSRQQQRLWQLQQQDHSGAYRSQGAVAIDGQLDREVFEAAVEKLFARHDILRTAFHFLPEMNMPLQVVDSNFSPNIESYDLRTFEPQQQTDAIERLFEQMFHSPAEKESSARLLLATISDARHILIISLSALCADNRTLFNIVEELNLLYAAYVCGEDLDADVFQYAQFSEWQNEFLAESAHEQAFWKEQSSVALQLPYQISTDTEAVFRPKCSATIHVNAVSQETFLLSCWQALLWRLTGSAQITIGAVIDGRADEELEGAIGPFARTLPISASFHEDLQFSQLLTQTEAAVRDAVEWQDYFDLPQDQSFCFEYTSQRINRNPHGPSFSIYKSYTCDGRFKIKLSCFQQSDTLSIQLHYDPSLFRSRDIDRLTQQLRTLIESAQSKPHASIAELNILSRAERQEVLFEFNDNKKQFPNDKLVFQLFEQHAQRTPYAIALVANDRQLTYRELNVRANQLAHYLRSHGIGRESLVGLCVERSVETIVGILGIFKAGAAYVPLESSLPKERLQFLIEDAQLKVLLTQQHLLSSIPAVRIPVLCLDSDWGFVAQQRTQNLASEVSGENAAYVIYTSGSTGKPKGVVVEHRQLLAYVHAIVERLDLPPQASYALLSTFAADLGHTATFPSLCTGGCLHVISRDMASDPHALEDYFTSHAIDCLKIIPSHLSMLTSGNSHVAPRRRLILGGEATDWKLIERVRETAPQCQIYNHYGPTETTVGAVSGEVQEERSGISSQIPLGRPIPNVQAFILNGAFNPSCVGEAGELYIGGDGVSRGYLNRPELTAEKFIPNPFSAEPGTRMYRTGDRARYLSGGNIEFLGRVDHQVKIRGFRIELGEIESTLVQHEDVREAVVIAHDDERGDKSLAAYIVANGHRPQPDELRKFLHQRLPDYMVPASFVQLQELPRHINGKLDRKALPAPAVGSADSDNYVAPANAVEEMLCGIWSEVLKVERVGIHNNFLELGGHSLLMIRVVARVREVFGVEIALGSVFDKPTVAELAREIEFALEGHVSTTPIPPLLPVSRQQELPLSFAQQRLWFINQLDPGSPLYNMPTVKRLSGALDVSALQRALNEIVRRHETLRTTFQLNINGEPVQVIGEGKLGLAIDDLRHLGATERDVEVERLAIQEWQEGFDLSTGPLIRARLVQLEDEEQVLLLNWHHIVSDGWSVDIFFRELTQLYHGYVRGEETRLAELPVQYADYAVWQREYLRGPVLDEQLAYWREQLRGAPAVLELPVDHPRPTIQTNRGAGETFVLGRELSRQLEELSQREGVTLFMSLLTALQVLLSRYSGQDDVVVGTGIAGRARPEVQPLIGFFVNTLVMRAKVQFGKTFRELLQQVRQTCLGAYAHQDIPFEKLVEELQPERSLSHQPLFQVMFQLQAGKQEGLALEGLKVGGIRAQHVELEHMTKFDLHVCIAQTQKGLVGEFQYRTDLFEARTIKQMTKHFQQLLESIVSDVKQPVHELRLLDEGERRQQLEEWNKTERVYPQECIHELFERQVARAPEAVAVVYADEEVSYGELNRRANQLAHYLRGKGVGPETLVGVMLERSVDLIVSLVAILKADGAYVPLDATYPAERLAFMMEDAALKVLVTEQQLRAALPDSGERTVICLEQAREEIEQESGENPLNLSHADELAYVIYTSGSTGIPKGVTVPHRAVNRLVCDTNYVELRNTDRIAQASNASFDALTFEVWGALLQGAALIGISKELALSPIEFAREIEARGITVMFLTTALFNQMARSAPESFRRLRYLLFGGEAVDPQWVREVLAKGTPDQLLHVYGPTENTTFSTWHEVKQVSAEATTVPIGGPLMNTTAYVLGANYELLPVGVAGELYLGGAGLAREYLRRPELTAERYVPHPFNHEAGARLYRTGDLVRWVDDGQIEFLGRVDQQVKVRGFRVELEEIEAALCGHELVAQAVVVVREHNGGDKRLVAYVTPTNGTAPHDGELRDYLRKRLPDYMMPGAFVVLNELPLTPNGKVDRRALPDVDHHLLREDYVAPRSPIEEVIAGIWSEVLDVGSIGVHDNFFNVGGHSLLATQVTSRLREIFQMELPLQAIFEFGTVASLAEYLQEFATEQGMDANALAIVSLRVNQLSDQEIVLMLNERESALTQNAEY